MNYLNIDNLNTTNITARNINFINSSISNLITNNCFTNTITLTNLNVTTTTITNLNLTNLVSTNTSATNLLLTNTSATNTTITNLLMTNLVMTNITSTNLYTNSLSLFEMGSNTSVSFSFFSGTFSSTVATRQNWIRIGNNLLWTVQLVLNLSHAGGAGITVVLPNSYTHSMGSGRAIAGVNNGWFGNTQVYISTLLTNATNTINIFYGLASPQAVFTCFIHFHCILNL